MSDEAGKPLNQDEVVDVAVKVTNGKVLLTWHRPRAHIFFQPQNCFELAEHMARAAHRARFPGEALRDDFHYLANQVKQRLTEQMRSRMQIRIRAMLPSLIAGKSYDNVAKQVVDTIFSALDDQGEYKL